MVQIPLKVIPALFIIGASLAWAYPIPIIGQAIPIVIFGTATALQVLQSAAAKRSFCCFHPNTCLEGGIKIKNVKIGDQIGNSMVTNIIICKNKESLYNYNGILVTGDHLVWIEKEDQYIRVEKM